MKNVLETWYKCPDCGDIIKSTIDSRARRWSPQFCKCFDNTKGCGLMVDDEEYYTRFATSHPDKIEVSVDGGKTWTNGT